MGFVEYNKIRANFVAAAKGVEELVSVDFSCAYNERCIRVFLSISCKYSYILRAEFVTEFLILRVCQCFERAGIPGTTTTPDQSPDLLAWQSANVKAGLKSRPTNVQAAEGV